MTKTYNQQDAELLDLLLNISQKDKGLGERLLSEWGTIGDLLQNIDAAGLTKRQHDVLKAAAGIHFVREEKAGANSPAEVAALCADLQFELQEHLVVLCLDRRNKIVHRENLYKGSVSSSQVRVGEIFRKPIILQSSAIIVVHNHPSGDPTPSPDDVNVTRAIVQAGKLLDIQLLDHIVIGYAGKFVSLKERGLGFS